MKIAVLKETYPGERRVALVPALIPALAKAGLDVLLESGAGESAGFPDSEYKAKGATIVTSRQDACAAEIILQVRCAGANPAAGEADFQWMRPGQTVIGHCDPLGNAKAAKSPAEKGVSLFALEMIPRITRAQGMDVLSSMATVAGYRAVLLGAMHLPQMFPMLMTAAGTLSAAKVFIIGAGVAGLQAIATAKRLGGVVSAYDVRPAVKEQVESVGARFIEMELETESAEGAGGYAKAMDEEFYEKQRALMAEVVADTDVVITTAAIPGRRSPLLITRQAVEGMSPGSVIIDLAAERGGNCELSEADQTVVHQGVTILGPTNLPSEVPKHASQMYAKNVTNLLLHLVDDGKLNINREDEIVRDTLMTHGGQIVQSRIREILELPPLDKPAAAAEKPDEKPTGV